MLEVDVSLGKALQNLLESEAPFEARQCCTEAIMDSHAESTMLARVSVYVENSEGPCEYEPCPMALRTMAGRERLSYSRLR